LRILVIEDDDRIADFLHRALNAEGYSVTRLNNGDNAVSIIQKGDFNCILLDLMLPGSSGLDVCQEIRFRKISIPIIMLTAMDGIEDIVHGLKMGADDYMTKPFDLDELIARIETVSRRHQIEDESNREHVIADVKMNTDTKTVSVSGLNISLTAKELTILELLMSNPDKLFSRERILSNVWGTNADPLTNVVDVYIGRLRKKLGKADKPFIETVRGMGYRIDQRILVDSEAS